VSSQTDPADDEGGCDVAKQLTRLSRWLMPDCTPLTAAVSASLHDQNLDHSTVVSDTLSSQLPQPSMEGQAMIVSYSNMHMRQHR